MRVAEVISFVSSVFVSVAAFAQTWSLSTSVNVTDVSGQACGVCPNQTITQTSTRSYTLPAGPRVLLNTDVDDALNEADPSLYDCLGGPPASQHCLDRSDGFGHARLRPRGVNVKQFVDVDAAPRTAGSASVTTTATGVGTVVWPGMPAGTPVPGTLVGGLGATGTLAATCMSTGSSEATLAVTLSLTGIARPGGGAPPAVAPATLNVTTGPCGGIVNGPYFLSITMGPGLQVGDQYSYSFTFTNTVTASNQGFGINHADARFGDTYELEMMPGSLPEIGFDLGVPDDCLEGDVNAGAGTRADVLLVNGTSGNQDHVLTLAIGQPITVSLDAAPAGPSPAAYALWVWRVPPTNPQPVTVSGATLGCTANPTPLASGQLPRPLRCMRGAGVPAVLCTGITELTAPPRAPWTRMRSGFTQPHVLTLQAVVADHGASNARGASVTNAVVLDVQ
jgi:hypothetical protein